MEVQKTGYSMLLPMVQIYDLIVIEKPLIIPLIMKNNVQLNWVERKLVWRASVNLKSQVWFWPKLHSIQFNYHFITPV